MVLNSQETRDKIGALFPNMPYNSFTYCGSRGDVVHFEIGLADKHGNYIAGVHIGVTQDYKLVSVERMWSTWGKYCKNKPLITEKIPIHPAGQVVSWRNSRLVCGMGDMRMYEYHKN